MSNILRAGSGPFSIRFAILVILALGLAVVPIAAEEGARTILTEDGARLRCERRCDPASRSRPTAPVILVHGFAANWRQFTLDEPDSPSLARTLERAGFEVWLVNLRGAGRGGEESLLPPGRRGWSLDDHILFDIPAVLDHVRAANGRPPVLIGHSLGGMVLGAWLTGATLREDREGDARLVIDAEIAAARNRSIAGLCVLGTPARFAWPEDARPDALLALAESARAPLRLLVPERIPASRLESPGSLGRFEDPVLELLGARERERAERLLKKLRGGVFSDFSEDTLFQIAAGARAGGFVSTRRHGPRVDYARNYRHIDAPLLAIVGERDRLAAPEVVERDLFEAVESSTRSLFVAPGYGHSDITLGPRAHRDVFREIVRWIDSLPPEESTESTDPARNGGRP